VGRRGGQRRTFFPDPTYTMEDGASTTLPPPPSLPLPLSTPSLWSRRDRPSDHKDHESSKKATNGCDVIEWVIATEDAIDPPRTRNERGRGVGIYVTARAQNGERGKRQTRISHSMISSRWALSRRKRGGGGGGGGQGSCEQNWPEQNRTPLLPVPFLSFRGGGGGGGGRERERKL
jgi:hypothetical protein